MSQKIVDTILSQSYTQTTALKRLRALREYLNTKAFRSGQEMDLSSLHLEEAEINWLNSLDKAFWQVFEPENISDLLDQAEEEIKQIQPLVIFIPLEIPQAEIDQIGERVRKTYGKNFLIEFKYDPSLIAGSALSWNGVYKDYSLRQRINQNQEQILTHLKNYIKR